MKPRAETISAAVASKVFSKYEGKTAAPFRISREEFKIFTERSYVRSDFLAKLENDLKVTHNIHMLKDANYIFFAPASHLASWRLISSAELENQDS